MNNDQLIAAEEDVKVDGNAEGVQEVAEIQLDMYGEILQALGAEIVQEHQEMDRLKVELVTHEENIEQLVKRRNFYDILINFDQGEKYTIFEAELDKNKPTFTMIQNLESSLLQKHSGVFLLYIAKNYPAEDNRNLLLYLVQKTSVENLGQLDKDRETILHITMFRRIHHDVQLALIAKMLDKEVSRRNNWRQTALHLAMGIHITVSVQLALINKMSQEGVDKCNKYNHTALYIYAHWGDNVGVALTLIAKMSVKALQQQSENNDTALDVFRLKGAPIAIIDALEIRLGLR